MSKVGSSGSEHGTEVASVSQLTHDNEAEAEEGGDGSVLQPGGEEDALEDPDDPHIHLDMTVVHRLSQAQAQYTEDILNALRFKAAVSSAEAEETDYYTSGITEDETSEEQEDDGTTANPRTFYDGETGEMYEWDDEQEDWQVVADRGGQFNMEDIFEQEDDGEEEELAELKEDGEEEEEDEETIPKTETNVERKSGKELEKEEGKEEETRKRQEVSEMSKASYRWFERRLLSQHMPKSDENLRRKRLLEKCQMVRKVSKPVLTLFGGRGGDNEEGRRTGTARTGSQESVRGSETEEVKKTFRDYTEQEWAMKQTIDFLTEAGCTESSGQTYSSSMRRVRYKDNDFRLNLYEEQLKKRRKAIGTAQQAPEITAAVRRHAERAVWRAVIDNTKPRYPLPRFILPRHRYLKKVQAQFIGPGSYEHDVYDALVKKRQMKMPSTWATCTSRFPKDPADVDGGKGGATRLLDPYESLDKANYKYKYPGTYIPFESTPKCWRSGRPGGSGIPPNYYSLKSPLDEYIQKKTSLRGPYDCYTPSRGVIPYGYHKTGSDEEKSRLGPGSYEVRTSLVKEMNDPYNFFKGVMCKADRDKMFGFKAAFDNPLWPKDNHIPPVGEYDVGSADIGTDKKQYKAPFKFQEGLKKRNQKRELTAPDYYYFGSDAKWTVEPKGADLASVFKSKTPQIMPQKVHHVRRERNRALNVYCDLNWASRKEEHYSWDTPVKNDYALEDCNDACLLPQGGGGPKADPYAIPGYGVGADGAGFYKSTGGCCGGL